MRISNLIFCNNHRGKTYLRLSHEAVEIPKDKISHLIHEETMEKLNLTINILQFSGKLMISILSGLSI